MAIALVYIIIDLIVFYYVPASVRRKALGRFAKLYIPAGGLYFYYQWKK